MIRSSTLWQTFVITCLLQHSPIVESEDATYYDGKHGGDNRTLRQFSGLRCFGCVYEVTESSTKGHESCAEGNKPSKEHVIECPAANSGVPMCTKTYSVGFNGRNKIEQTIRDCTTSQTGIPFCDEFESVITEIQVLAGRIYTGKTTKCQCRTENCNGDGSPDLPEPDRISLTNNGSIQRNYSPIFYTIVAVYFMSC